MLEGVASSAHERWRPFVGERTRVAATRALLGALVLIGVYVALKTLGAPEPVLLGWMAIAAALAVVSVVGGVTILAAIGPFTEAVTDDGRITAIPILLAAVGVGALLAGARALLARRLVRPPVAIALAVALLVGTLAAVALSAALFGASRGIEALQLWVAGIGGGITVLIASWLVGTTGELRPLVVLAGSVTAAAALSAIDFVSGGLVRESLFGWLLRAVEPGRLTGIIPAPNAAAAIFLVGLALTGAAFLFGRRWWLRASAAGASAVLLSAIVLTYSRSALLALVVLGAILGWRLAGWWAIALLAVAAAMLLAVAAVMPGIALIRDVPFWADEARLLAWSAAGAMWLDSPLIGHGLRSFEWLHAEYGSALDAPHNEWLRFFAEGGVILGVMALAFLAAAILALLRVPGWLGAAGAAALAGVALMAAFNNLFLYPQVNIPLFIAAGLALGLGARTAPRGVAVT